MSHLARTFYFFTVFFQTWRMKKETLASELRDAITTLEDGCRVYGDEVSLELFLEIFFELFSSTFRASKVSPWSLCLMIFISSMRLPSSVFMRLKTHCTS